jgi:XTP/dITP diphosphohydrolase
MKTKIILASNNQKKLYEMQDILSRMGIDVVAQADAGITAQPDETGLTFEENALIKAETVMRLSGLPAMADDSGLVVEALNGQPGVFSARYGGEACRSDADRVELLLKNMQDKEQRAAKFVSCIACVFPNGDKLISRGECAGEISREPRGDFGFGYDPVFYLPQYGKTMAELDPERKNTVSHRAASLANLRTGLEEYLNKQEGNSGT